jgi:RsiW-degrading membrane proteinase PrsW (M82 family)
MKFQELTLISLIWGFFSILPWAYAIWVSFPKNNESGIASNKFLIKLIGFSILAFLAGILSTYLILELNPILWPQVNIKPKRPQSLLTQTVHIAFIQAGMIEESFKIGFILLIGLLFFRSEQGDWEKGIFLIAGFTALGFAFIENSYYIITEIPEKRLETFLGRTVHSSNIHLLINLTFALFCLKSNQIQSIANKWYLILGAFFLAVIQHGVVDFFLIPSSILGAWIATALFVGIWVWVVRDFRVFVLDKKMEPI